MTTKFEQEAPKNQALHDISSEHVVTPTPPDSSAHATQGSTKNARLLNRSEAALALGISKSEFCRRESLGFYEASLVDERGWHLFSIEYLTTLPGYGTDRRDISRSTKAAKVAKLKEEVIHRGSYDPEIASAVFQDLNAGMSSRDIVIKRFIHPDVMTAVYEAWKRMALQDGGGIVVSAKQMAIINELPLPGVFPILTSDQLVLNMTKASRGTDMCPICKARACQVCAVCAQPEPAAPPPSPTPAPTKRGGPSKPKPNYKYRPPAPPGSGE